MCDDKYSYQFTETVIRAKIMNLVIINGSHRTKSNSRKVSDRLKQIADKVGFKSASIVDLHEELPVLWNEDFWDSESEQFKERNKLTPRLENADAFVLVSPEYGGMASPIIKNFLLSCSTKETGHKPAVLVGVSAGEGGTYPISEIRSFAFKNSFLCFIPANIIVKNSNDVFNDDLNTSDSEQRLLDYSEYAINILLSYASALTEVRSSGGIDFEKYPYGV